MFRLFAPAADAAHGSTTGGACPNLKNRILDLWRDLQGRTWLFCQGRVAVRSPGAPLDGAKGLSTCGFRIS